MSLDLVFLSAISFHVPFPLYFTFSFTNLSCLKEKVDLFPNLGFSLEFCSYVIHRVDDRTGSDAFADKVGAAWTSEFGRDGI